MRLIEAIRAANQPGPPENSVRLRVACAAAVIIAIAACQAQSEISRGSALVAMVLVALGTAFSNRTRERPPGWIKIALAVAAVGSLAWFVHQINSHAVSDVTAVENPLTVLFVAIQVLHSFHVPARRDLAFSLGGSTALLAVAAAQAIDLRLAVYGVIWAVIALWGLSEMWSAASRGGRVSRRGTAMAVGGVTLVTAALFLSLPAPRVTIRVNFLARPGAAGPISVPGGLAGDTAAPTQLARPGTPTGRARVGGYLGFADRLDTALRGRLGNAMVMRVRADRPSYWVGETFDTWDGQGWTESARANQTVGGISPFIVPATEGAVPGGVVDYQTFFIATSTPDLIFHAERARQVWFPASNIFARLDGTLLSPIGLGPHAVYTVESAVNDPGAGDLRASALDTSELAPAARARYTQLPHPYPQVQALVDSVTAGALTPYDRLQALVAWIGAHTRYSLNIPPLPPGADTVNEFLFGSRIGFCEQISTSLTVMLRSLGVATREVVGYVADAYNPITDLWEVRAKDAHAWVQVWFPGWGWQSFDPTANVPTVNPPPGTTALRDLGHGLARIPAAPAGGVVAAAGLVVAIVGWRRRRRATWAERVAREIERAGARSGRRRRAGETISEYAAALGGDADGEWQALAAEVSAAAYGGRPLSEEEGRRALAAVRAARRRVPAGSG